MCLLYSRTEGNWKKGHQPELSGERGAAVKIQSNMSRALPSGKLKGITSV